MPSPSWWGQHGLFQAPKDKGCVKAVPTPKPNLGPWNQKVSFPGILRQKTHVFKTCFPPSLPSLPPSEYSVCMSVDSKENSPFPKGAIEKRPLKHQEKEIIVITNQSEGVGEICQVAQTIFFDPKKNAVGVEMINWMSICGVCTTCTTGNLKTAQKTWFFLLLPVPNGPQAYLHTDQTLQPTPLFDAGAVCPVFDAHHSQNIPSARFSALMLSYSPKRVFKIMKEMQNMKTCWCCTLFL